METLKTSVAIHTPNGPVWLSAGQQVPKELEGQVREGLLFSPASVDPAPPAEKAGEVEGERPPLEHAAPNEDQSALADSGEPDRADAEKSEESVGQIQVPYTSYSAEQWAEFAAGFEVNTEGMSKAKIIAAVAEKLGVKKEGSNPAALVDAIREKLS